MTYFIKWRIIIDNCSKFQSYTFMWCLKACLGTLRLSSQTNELKIIRCFKSMQLKLPESGYYIHRRWYIPQWRCTLCAHLSIVYKNKTGMNSVFFCFFAFIHHSIHISRVSHIAYNVSSLMRPRNVQSLFGLLNIYLFDSWNIASILHPMFADVRR